MVVVNQVLILVMLIVAGVITKKLKVVGDAVTKEVGSLVINVTLPAYIITAMNQSFSKEILVNSGILVLMSFGIYAGSIVLAKSVTKIMGVKSHTRDVFEYVMIFSNVGYMGYPVLDVAFGKTGVFYGAVFNLPFNVLVWSYGVWLLNRHGSGQKELSRNMFNPGLVAVLLGFALFAFSIKLPTPLFMTLQLIGGVSTPLSMMFVGFILADVHVMELLKQWQCVILSFFRLIFIPGLLLVILKLFGLKGMMLGVPVLLMGMPASANTAILASQFDSDYLLASKVIFVSTFLSIFTIPILLGIIAR